MSNNSTSNKLDNFIKESLENVDVNTPADWDMLERKLDQQPTSVSEFKVNFNPKLITGIVTGIATISIIAYLVSSSNSDNNTATPSVVNEVVVVEEEENTAASKYTPRNQQQINADYSLPTNEELGVIEFAIAKEREEPVSSPIPVVASAEEVSANTTPVESNNEAAPQEEEKTEITTDPIVNAEGTDKEEDEKAEDGETNFLDVFNELKDKNEVPTFGDMIDPKKGFTKPTGEEERLKKEAEKKVKENNDTPSNDAPKPEVADSTQN